MTARRGFTLIEVMIAMALFALVSAMTFQGLHGSMRVQESIDRHADELAETQMIWALMLQDFMHLARRPVRDRRGDRHPAFDLKPEECAVEFTRVGAAHTGGLQRVAYCVDDGALRRRVWQTLDRTDSTEYIEATLLEDVSLTVRAKTLSLRDKAPDFEYAQPPTLVKVELRVGERDYYRFFPGVTAEPFAEFEEPVEEQAGEPAGTPADNNNNTNTNDTNTNNTNTTNNNNTGDQGS